MHSNCESLLAAMVGFDTVNSYITGQPDPELELAKYLESKAQTMGFETKRFPVSGAGFNLMVSNTVAEEAPWLLFESHLDTVSLEGMIIDPLGARIEGGRMYGRGACDTKASGAAMLWALKCYAAGSEKPNNVAILFSLDEEILKRGIRSFAKHHLLDLGWNPSGVIIGEPTELAPVVAHNGAVRWKIRTEGIAAHSSKPSNGRSAISMMVKVIDLLESGYIPTLSATHPLTGKAECSINQVQGGEQINIIPECCEIAVDRRTVPGEDPEKVLPTVELLLDSLRRENPDLKVCQDEPFIVDVALNPEGGEAFAGYVQTVLRSLDLPTELEGVGYGTDGSTLSDAGVPTVVIGPGNIAQGHTADEWIDLEQLKMGVEVYLKLMCTSSRI